MITSLRPRRILGAVSKGYQDAIADPEAAADALLAAAPELDPELVQKSAVWLGARYTDDAKAWGLQDGKVWDDFVAFLDQGDRAAERRLRPDVANHQADRATRVTSRRDDDRAL